MHFAYKSSRAAHQTISSAMTLLTTAAYRENSTRSSELKPAQHSFRQKPKKASSMANSYSVTGRPWYRGST